MGELPAARRSHGFRELLTARRQSSARDHLQNVYGAASDAAGGALTERGRWYGEVS